MTRDDVIRMAREADAMLYGMDKVVDCMFTPDTLERFTDIVIEACAQHLETSGDRYRRDYFAAKVRELKTQAPAQPAGKP